ncbi:hypothetical protein AKJ51_00520 [candidate division MSBL1 archaeon SCGC-AAA382A20]|uniref:histidine kinase n=1 Tax=candidate division MSBL1 archaeon SCGC-AAA382A20 TaxID=1698280 RepID=A0A133VMN2_9EURY|nr:hypothetical protein AKJ51_00520 [candidate division MSBL1 archaeon SCGC-AAA382A20]
MSDCNELEEILSGSREKYQEIFNSLNDAVFIHPPDGKFKAVNDTAVDRLGYSREELLSKSPRDIDASDYLVGFEGRLEKLQEEGSLVFETEHVTKDGESIPVEISAKLIGTCGENLILSVARDITERKIAEQKFENFFETIPDLGFIVNSDGVVEELNGVLTRKSGYSVEEIEGLSVEEIAEIFVEGNEEKILENFERLMSGEKTRRHTVKYRAKNGDARFAELSSSPLTVEGEIVGAIGIARDITEKKKTKEREEFLHSLLRHDVRNKAQIAKGYFELLDELDLPEKAEEYLEKAEKACGEGIEIIEKVRTMRELGREENIDVVNIRPVIGDVLEEHSDQISEKGMDVECEVGETKVVGGLLLKELFSNLVGNSIRHSEGDLIKISSKGENGESIVSVEDNGRGLPDEDKERIFEKGYRKGKTAGSGLGMYLAKEIVESYDGFIDVGNSKLGGAKFDVHLKKA